MKEEKLIEKAKKRVQAKKEFMTHFGIYVAAIVFLFVINWLTSPGFWWFMIAGAAWGIGIVAHYLAVFGFPHPAGKNWEDEALKKEIRKLKAQEGSLKDPGKLEIEDELKLKDYRMDTMDYEEDEFV